MPKEHMTLFSLEFVVLLFAAIVLYFIIPLKWRWTVLLAASAVFYFYGGIGTGYFMILATVCVYFIARWLDKFNTQQTEYFKANPDIDKEEKKKYRLNIQHTKRLILAVGLIICFGFLIALKYFNFLWGQVFSIFGIAEKAPRIDIALPLGISFYTLQATSYIIDVYRGKYAAEKNFFKVALFVMFFPQMIQGPIGRFNQLGPQLFEGRKFDFLRLKMGLQLMLWGLMKKFMFAEYTAVIADEIFNNYTEYSGLLIFVGSIAYGLQVYADFSGGMDIVRGAAQIFGIDLAVNFERPYFARSLAEFWRRWHITLGAWMREYVFYPLSLSKAFTKLGKATKKVFGNNFGLKLPTFLASFIAFFLVGVWHGSDNKYVIYGLWNSVIITSSIMLEPVYLKIEEKLHIKTEMFGWKFFQIVRTFIIVSIGRIFSRADTLAVSFEMIKKMFSTFNIWTLTDNTIPGFFTAEREFAFVVFMGLVIFAVSLAQEKGIKIRETLEKQNVLFRWFVIISAVLALLIFGKYGAGYSAVNFVYQQF